MSERVATADIARVEAWAAGEEGPAARVGIDLVRAVEAHVKTLRVYPPAHRRVSSTLDGIRAVLSPYLAVEEAIEIALTGEGLLCNREPLDPDAPVVREFAGELKKRRIRSLRFRRGIEVEEIRALGEILTSDHRRLLLRGGIEIAFPPADRPHLEIELFAIRDLLAGDGELGGLLPQGAERLRDHLGSDAIRRRVRDLQVLLRGSVPDDSDEVQIDLIGVIVERLLHVDAWALDAEKACAVVSRFLETLEEGLQERKETGTTLGPEDLPEILASALTRADPDDLLQFKSKLGRLLGLRNGRNEIVGEASPSSADAEFAGFPGGPELRSLARLPTETLERFERVPFDPRAFVRELAAHDLDVEAIGIASEILVSLPTEGAYREAREGLMRLFRQASRRVESFVRAALYLARELPPPPMEERVLLLAEILRQDVDRAAILRFLEVQEDRPEDLLRILQVFLEKSPCLLLETATRLLGHPLLASLRAPIEDLILEALESPGASSAWLGKDPEGVMEAETFEFIAARAPSVARAIVRRILAAGPADLQEKLIRRLRQGVPDAGIEWLVEGLAETDRALRLRTIEILGEFRDPRAAEALREILRRQNEANMIDGEEVHAVLRALARMDTREAAAELRSVRSGRRFLRRAYRKEIRRALAEILREERP